VQDLSGKVALVTGGASGIGKSMVRALLNEGMKVAIADVEDDALAATVSEFSDANNQLMPVQVDVTRSDAVAEARATVEAQLGRVSPKVQSTFIKCTVSRSNGLPNCLTALWRGLIGIAFLFCMLRAGRISPEAVKWRFHK